MSSGPSILCYSDPSIVSFQCSRVCKCSVLVGERYFVFKPNLHFRFEMGESWGKRGWGWKAAKVRSVCTGLRPCLISHDTFVKQCVTHPSPHTHKLSEFLYLRELSLCCLPAQTLRLAFHKSEEMNEIWSITSFFYMVAWEALEGYVLSSLPDQACLFLLPGLLWAVWGLGDWQEAVMGAVVLYFLLTTLKVSLWSAAQGQVIPWNLKGDEWNPWQSDAFWDLRVTMETLGFWGHLWSFMWGRNRNRVAWANGLPFTLWTRVHCGFDLHLHPSGHLSLLLQLLHKHWCSGRASWVGWCSDIPFCV